jgi:DNA-directed RNA polymerase I, II, and III subunit RPABC3
MEVLFEDTYGVTELDASGKQFDNLTRISALGRAGSAIVLDVNCQLFPVGGGDQFRLVVSKSESPKWDPAIFEAFQGAWDYVMHGKIYRWQDGRGQSATVHVSCGGLLLALTGRQSDFGGFHVGHDVFLQLRRV